MLANDTYQSLKTLLKKHEGFSDYPYKDVYGNLTIGYGHNLDARRFSKSMALAQLDEDIHYYFTELNNKLEIFKKLDDARKVVLINMCFNLGVKGLLGFKEMIKALKRNDYTGAAKEMLLSKWAQKDVGIRAQELADIMKKGEME